MGIGSYYYSDPITAEYVQCRLNQSLLVGHQYQCTFYINLANHSEYTINNFGVLFSPNAITATGSARIVATPQIFAPAYLTDTLNWTRVSQTFTAMGGEEWMTIGRFDFNGLPGLQAVLPDTNPFFPDLYCYYLIDSVSLFDITSENYIPPLPNVFSPNGDGTNDLFYGFYDESWTNYSLTIFNRWGNAIVVLKKGNNTWDGADGNNAPCSEGVYYYVLEAVTGKGQDISKKGFIQLVR
jgi:gliding motility-associated-like protein